MIEAPRPEPPERLSGEAKAAWREIVNAFRSDWFQGAEGVLEAYVNNLVLARQLVAELGQCKSGGERWVELTRLHVAVVSSLTRCATTLRLTPQSTRDSRNAKHVSTVRKPWLDVDDSIEQPVKPS
jgi:phage terminase small subunit